ncbi:hypothetical protein LPJ61_004830 [Coemansia biformis]|uniref:Arrestin-like N-terminal domain-containing protein n=1 Tax=Coemansia biformis TaxID=1286918 RepID=A0A9W8CUB4_9FUNG|nr:hypothetical protein LPJ61_004830 [Coemansia biformis]
MSASVFEIRFPAYTSGGTPRCAPKSTLAGVVYLHITEPLQAACLSLSLVGSERISLAPASVNSAWPQTVTAPAAAKPRSVKKVYFNQSTVLWGDGKLRESGVLPEGVHMFHFSCEFPRINYPQSKTTSEYEIKYMLRAKLLGPRDSREPTLMTAAQDVDYIPETVAQLLPAHTDSAIARYAFCDNTVDADGQQWAFHLSATGLQQAFSPGGAVDLQLRITGQRTLRKLQFCLIEQTDCFYPHVPEPHEEQLDIGRRLWSSQRVLCEPTALHFERDSCVPAVDLCSSHMGGKGQSRSGLSTYHAQLHVRLPADAQVLHESGFLRFTCFVQLTLSAGSTAWGAGPARSALVKVPIPIVTRVLSENAAALAPPPLSCTSDTRTPHHAASLSTVSRRQSSGAASVCSSGVYTRPRGPSTSSSVKTDVDSLDLPGLGSDAECGPADPPLKHGRSIADLGARLQQFIPRRLPSASFYGRHNRPQPLDCQQQPPASADARRLPFAGRAVSHGRISDHFQPQWSMADLPPMPKSAGAVSALGAYSSAHASQSTLFNSPLARSASLGAANDSDSVQSAIGTRPPSSVPHCAQQQQQQVAASTPSAVPVQTGGSRFSLTFLLWLREMFNEEANAAALSCLISGHDSDEGSAIPRAICRAPVASASLSRPGQPQARRGEYRSRDFSLGFGGMGLGKRNKRSSVVSLSSMVASSDRVRPRLEAVMASFRDPVTSLVATWTALGSSGRPQSMHYHPAHAQKEQMARNGDAAATAGVLPASRFSRLSAMSVSSNDTACASNGCLSLPKDVLPPLPSPLSPLVDVSTATFDLDLLR